MKFLLTPSLLVQTLKWWEHRKWSPRMKCLDFEQILLTSSIRNVWRTVRRICIFISGLKRIPTWKRWTDVCKVLSLRRRQKWLMNWIWLVFPRNIFWYRPVSGLEATRVWLRQWCNVYINLTNVGPKTGKSPWQCPFNRLSLGITCHKRSYKYEKEENVILTFAPQRR